MSYLKGEEEEEEEERKQQRSTGEVFGEIADDGLEL